MNEFQFFVDDSKCIKCGACIRDCALEMLEFDPERELPHVIPGTEDSCTRCQHCLAICPTGALEIFGRDPEESLPPDSNPDPEEILSLIANRRSFRSYRHENLDAVTLDKLKDMLKFVPTGVNSHSLCFAFVDDVNVMDEFRKCVSDGIAAMFKQDPLPPFLARMARYHKQLRRGKDVEPQWKAEVAIGSKKTAVTNGRRRNRAQGAPALPRDEPARGANGRGPGRRSRGALCRS